MKATKNALIVVDLQNDFMPGGALAVKNGDDTVPVANRLMPLFDIVVASQDWHPKNHGSFASQYLGKTPGQQVELAGINQTLWPDHCVQESAGSQFAQALESRYFSKVFRKGTDPTIDSYSTFFDNAHRRETGLHKFLTENRVESVYVLGLATDYCVKFSVIDAVNLGYKTYVIVDGCRGVELVPGDTQNAFDEMGLAGAKMLNSGDVKAHLS